MTTQHTAKPPVPDELAGPTPYQINIPRWSITIVLGSIVAGLILWLVQPPHPSKPAGPAGTADTPGPIGPAKTSEPLAAERAELERLSELPDPTPEQWKRRIDLRVKIEAHEAEEARRRNAIRQLKINEDHDPRVLAIQKQRQIDQLMLWGWESLVEGKLDSAVTFYQAVIDRYPDNPEADQAAGMIRQIKEGKEGDQP